MQALPASMPWGSEGRGGVIAHPGAPRSTLKVRRLGEVRAVVLGAPPYLRRRGRPQHPDELKDHDCVVRLTDGDPKHGRSALPAGAGWSIFF